METVIKNTAKRKLGLLIVFVDVMIYTASISD